MIYNHQLSAQDNGRLRGIVTDATSGEALAFGNVFIKELGAGSSTDTKGYFMIPSLPANKIYSVTVSYVGYQTRTIEVFIARDKITQIEIKLDPTGIELQTIEKIGDRTARPNETNISLDRITVQDLERIPRGVEMDVLRSLQYLPGVSSFGDASARYNVRGGASNQNLVLLDGVTIYNPFHALGMFSVIDPELINSIEFYKGGFPPEYGGRLSSVLKISTKQGNQVKYGGAASAGLLTAKALVEGPLPHGSFIFTGRKSHSSGILKKFLNDKDAPVDFYDLSFRLTYHNSDPDFIDNSKWTIHGFFSRDNLNNESPFKEDFKWSNNILGMKRFQVYDTPLYSELSISMSEFKGELISKQSNARPRQNELRDFTVRMDFNYIYDNRNELGVGMIFNAIRTRLLLLNGAGVFTELDDFGANISIYFKYKFLKYKNFGADAGIRINLEGLKDRGNFFGEPRINMTYRFTPEIALKGAWGIFQQGITTISDENEVVSIFEPWFLTPAYLDPASATHYNIGLETNISKFLTCGYRGILQEYEKSSDNQP